MTLRALCLTVLLLFVGCKPADDSNSATATPELPPGVDMQDIEMLVLAPEHIQEASSAESVPLSLPPQFMADRGFDFDQLAVQPRLDVEGFLTDIDQGLHPNVMGYVLQIQRNGQIEHTRQRLWARTPQDEFQFWKPDVAHHVASVSKFITAVAMVKALRDNGVSLDARIFDFLPDYWNPGQHTDLITFRHLLTHTSGIGGSNAGPVGFASVRQRIEAGVPVPATSVNVWPFDYENGNFTLLRILLPVVTKQISTSFNVPIVSRDKLWNGVTARLYKNYVEDNILNPAGVTGASLNKRGRNSLAYRRAGEAEQGWSSGDFTSSAGSVGWHFTTRELLRIAHAVSEPDTILSALDFKLVLEEGFGIVDDEPLNKLQAYYLGGSWTRNGTNHNERSFLMFLPNNRQMVVFVNSPGGSFQSTILNAYLDNVTLQQVLDQ